ncbi:hypothetical protein IHE45_06G058400 [Dioscorea alata]|uniref:Uncharacterized protein n=1 Tax=Dioscorea alata TaxID=55571 RepID=A0ACB7VXK2_DIOAL|nr:hypothetical protein IHE45_06G058400 [Dioscorea alata]
MLIIHTGLSFLKTFPSMVSSALASLLVIVSVHHTTDVGDHGASILAFFIGIGPGYQLYAPNEHNEVFQFADEQKL